MPVVIKIDWFFVEKTYLKIIFTSSTFISKTIKYFGIKTIHGSSSKGGTKAIRNIFQTLKKSNV